MQFITYYKKVNIVNLIKYIQMLVFILICHSYMIFTYGVNRIINALLLFVPNIFLLIYALFALKGIGKNSQTEDHLSTSELRRNTRGHRLIIILEQGKFLILSYILKKSTVIFQILIYFLLKQSQYSWNVVPSS